MLQKDRQSVTQFPSMPFHIHPIVRMPSRECQVYNAQSDTTSSIPSRIQASGAEWREEDHTPPAFDQIMHSYILTSNSDHPPLPVPLDCP